MLVGAPETDAGAVPDVGAAVAVADTETAGWVAETASASKAGPGMV